jgi:hypothetical protein
MEQHQEQSFECTLKRLIVDFKIYRANVKVTLKPSLKIDKDLKQKYSIAIGHLVNNSSIVYYLELEDGKLYQFDKELKKYKPIDWLDDEKFNHFILSRCKNLVTHGKTNE